MHSKTTFLELLETYSLTPICPPPPSKNYSGAVASLPSYWPRFNAYTHVETENSSIVQIERSRINCEVLSYSSSGENQTIDENENAVLTQTELRLYGRNGLS